MRTRRWSELAVVVVVACVGTEKNRKNVEERRHESENRRLE